MRSLSRLLAAERIIWTGGDSKEEVLGRLVEAVVRTVPTIETDALLRTVLEREGLHSTGIGLGLALPHARLPMVKDFVVALGVHRGGLPFGSFDGRPVHILALVVGPTNKEDEYLKVLSRVSRFLRAQRDAVLSAADAAAVHALSLDY
ncbi:MAG: PTS sugar transporter subunit IIA [Planctomycetes bacterium]|nr:PTS sugar transporter subunit IIA [Planctomycetota bacterium]